ncbi:SDR family oxidoreductase, partial [Candidatus Pelagibacter sp.]|nr:SDR family oxidoreductase [Candidatus Pelagibacter sp.]
TKLIIEKMKKNGGTIVNITSVNSELGFSNNPGYVSSKGGLKMLTKSFCMDYTKYNIRINNIGPGYIKTDMTKKKSMDKKQRKERLNRILMKRYGEPHELFGGVLFLLTDASSYITGQDLYIDGGLLSKGI